MNIKEHGITIIFSHIADRNYWCADIQSEQRLVYFHPVSTGPHRQGHDMTISSLQSGHGTTRWIEGQGSRRLAVTERSPVVIVADSKEKQGPEGSASYSHCITAQLDSHLWGTPTLWQITGSSNSPANWRQHGRALWEQCTFG